VLRFFVLFSASVLVAILGACDRFEVRGQEQPAGLVAQGAELYNANCLSCHGGPTGGSMSDMPPRHNANGHTWHHPDCQLTDIILNGSGEMGEMMRRMMGKPDAPAMPTFRDRLSEDDVRAILAYIKTWWTEEQRQTQARISQERC
jgi:mono/diheme cytochrome c family protein